MPYYQNGNRIDQNISNTENFFKEKNRSETTIDEVREYLRQKVSEITSPVQCEYGEMRVSIEKLKELVEEGYNIVKVLNPEDLTPYNIHIQYQKYDKTKTNKRGRK